MLTTQSPVHELGVSAAHYREAAVQAIEDATLRNATAITDAADIVSRAVRDGAVIHAFGSGHSQAGAMELAGRAGGLIPTNRLSISDLVLREFHGPELLADPLLERREDIGRELFQIADIRPGDVLMMMSNSGINGSVVELAAQAHDFGTPVIAITSLAHSSIGRSGHSSGKRLSEIADVVLDNCAPYGDAVLHDETGLSVCAVSSVTTAVLVQCIVAEAVSRLIAAGVEPPVYVSANVPGGHERNLVVEASYGARLRRVAG